MTLGDLLLDVVVRLDTGLVPGDDQPAHTSTGPGGQAANVAAWAASLGADATFVGRDRQPMRPASSSCAS